MTITFSLVGLAVLFYLLGKSADLIVLRVKDVAEQIGIKVFFMGIILGLLTSLPEFSIGVSSLAEDIPEISFGNLLGGIMVLFGVVLGLGAILNRKIVTDGKPTDITLASLYILLPPLIALDGTIGFFEGLLLVLAYFFLVYHLYTVNKLRHKRLPAPSAPVKKMKKKKKMAGTHELFKKMFVILIGLTLILVLSNAIVKITHGILEKLGLAPFVVGLLVFALGTNLPEIIVAVRSWRNHIKELSLANIIGSAIANAFIVGLLATTKTIPATINVSYITLIFFMLAILGITIRFYQSEKSFSRKEGVLLVFTYGAFLLTQIALL